MNPPRSPRSSYSRWRNSKRPLVRVAIVVVWCAIMVMPANGRAIRDRPPMTDVKHVSWPMEEGAPSRIGALGQSRDGYLWIGSGEGLFRFDGASFEKIRPDDWRGGPFIVSALLGARSGDVWIGLARSGGVQAYRRGRLVDMRMPNPSREVTGLAETRDGAMWVARGGRFVNVLARYRRGRWQQIGADWGLPAQRVWQLLVAHDGALWIVLNNTVMRPPLGARRFETTGARVTWRSSIAEDPYGRIWVSDGDGTRLLIKGGARQGSDASERRSQTMASTKIWFDGTGGLWGATVANGLFRIDAAALRQGANGLRKILPSHALAGADGLTSDQARSLFIDRENNVWIGTELGLDMVRRADVTVEPAIPPNSAETYHIAAEEDGIVYISDADTLYRIEPGRSPQPVLRTRSVPAALCAARGGGVWLVLHDAALRVAGTRVNRFAKPTDATYYGCVEDKFGRLWLPAVDRGLLWREKGSWRRWPGLRAGVGVPGDVALDPSGKAAILFRNPLPASTIAPFLRITKERLRIGNLESLLPGRRALMVGGAQGLAALTTGGVRTLAAARYPWIGSINGLVQTAGGDTWTIGDAGIVRMPTRALDAAFGTRGSPLSHRVYDFNDGLNSFAQKASGLQAVEGGDGRLWFLTRRNVLTVDPRRLQRNVVPPTVLIRSLVVGDHRYRDPTTTTLPAGTTDLSINYTATSLTVPGRVQFRYRLDGIDKDWINPKGRRNAAYSGLGPGSYRFHVIASNNDGVWNRDGVELGFDIPPTLAQTWPVRAAMLLAIGLIIWVLYSLRLRQVSARIRGRIEVRSAERERIARDLHDTLLQSVQGLIIRFHAIGENLLADDPTRVSIDRTLDRAEDLLVEGREKVHDLRTHGNVRLETLLEELADTQPFEQSTTIDVQTLGASRPICGPVAEEIGRIAGEALFNAARHARATRVEVRADYGRKRLAVTIRDDGVGFDSPHSPAQRGHYGVLGMRERADRMGGSLCIAAHRGRGTSVVLSIPAAIAYQRESEPMQLTRWWRFLRRRARRSES